MRTVNVPPGPLDWHLKTYREPGTVFHLGPGEYFTQGCFAFEAQDLCMLAPECALLGDLYGRTVIKPVNPVMTHGGRATRYYEALTGGSRTNRADSRSLTITNVHIVLPVMDEPVVGIHTWSSEVTLRHVSVTGVSGSRDHAGSVKEGFGLLLNNCPASQWDGGHTIEDCQVALRFRNEENYSTGIYVGAVLRPGVPMRYSRVARCAVLPAVMGVGHAAYAANALTVFEDCECAGVRRAFFADTGPVEGVEIYGMRAREIEWALDLRVAVPGDTRKHIRVQDSTFHFRPQRSGTGWVQAVRLEDETGQPPSTRMHSLTIADCQFETVSAPASKGRFKGMVSHVELRDVRWLGDWQDLIVQDGAKPWEETAPVRVNHSTNRETLTGPAVGSST